MQTHSRMRLTLKHVHVHTPTHTVAHNLDPFMKFSTQELENVLLRVGLAKDMLDSSVGVNGSNLSLGQQTLLSVARVLLRPKSIVVMDQPPANIDSDSDARLQKIIRKEFASCTLIMVAHRLHHVADFDRVLVLDEGRCVEFNTPAQLLRMKSGRFKMMVASQGNATASTIHEKARLAEAANEAAGNHLWANTAMA